MDIYYAGAESEADWNCLIDAGIDRILNSFYHLRGKQKGLFQRWRNRSSNIRIFLDCGAFTFFQKHINLQWNKRVDKKEILNYFNSYLRFIDNYGDSIYAIFNFDIDPIIGEPQVREWDEKYFKPLEKYIKVFYVHHHDYGIGEELELEVSNVYGSRFNYECKRFKKLCREHKNIAISELEHPYSNIIPSAKFWSEDKWLRYTTDYAKKFNCRIHGLAQTKNKVFEKYTFYSVDSSSWLSGGKYGTTFYFDGNKMRTFQAQEKERRKQFYSLYKRWGIDIDLIEKDVRNEVNKANTIMWKYWSVYLTIRKAHKIWWLSEKEKRELFNIKMKELNNMRVKGIHAVDFRNIRNKKRKLDRRQIVRERLGIDVEVDNIPRKDKNSMRRIYKKRK